MKYNSRPISAYKVKKLFPCFILSIFAMAPLANCQPQPQPLSQSCTETPSLDVRHVEIHPKANHVSSHLKHKEVVLTFDDGPEPARTQKVLNVLDKYCLKASFFLQGSNVKKHPEFVTHILDRGHSVGSHTFDHSNLMQKSIDDAIAEIERGNDALSKAVAGHSKADQTFFFRFPFVATSPDLDTAVTQIGYSIISVDVDGADWTENSAEDSSNMIMQKLSEKEEKGIILLHDPLRDAEKRLELLIQKLIEQNYTIVHFVPAKN